MEKITASILYNRLINSGLQGSTGKIQFLLNGTSVIIKTTDIVGNCIQSWLKQWMSENNIYFSEPLNTQIFPDFYLSEDETEGLLEIKAFNYFANPAFDIANFEAYCDSLETKSYRLDADYLIFGYSMNAGEIKIEKIWLKKIWEISGRSTKHALNTQVKRNVIYNIRPVSNFKSDRPPVFNSKEEFLSALFLCLKEYRGQERADKFKENFLKNYFHYNKLLLKF